MIMFHSSLLFSAFCLKCEKHFYQSQIQFFKKAASMTSKVERRASVVWPPMVQKAPKGFLEFSVTRHGCCLFFHLNISDSLVLQQSRSSDSDAGNYSWRKQWFIIPPLFFVVLSSDKEIPFVPCPTSIGFLCGFSLLPKFFFWYHYRLQVMVTHQKSHCEITSHMVSHEGGSTYQL